MQYEIKINPVKDSSSSVKAFAEVTIENKFTLMNIAIVQGKENQKMYVLFPNHKTNELDKFNNSAYKEYFNPITKEFRSELVENVLEAYKLPNKTLKVINNERFSVSVKVNVSQNNAQLAIASAYFSNCLIVNGIRLYESQEKGNRFLSFPSQKTNKLDENHKAVYKDICYPITKEFKNELTKLVEDAYEKELNQEYEH